VTHINRGDHRVVDARSDWFPIPATVAASEKTGTRSSAVHLSRAAQVDRHTFGRSSAHVFVDGPSGGAPSDQRAARVTTAMPTMTQPPSVCGSVLHDSSVNDPPSSRWFGVPTGSAFTVTSSLASTLQVPTPTTRRSRTSPGAWSVLTRYGQIRSVSPSSS
jgi:hypothetical protein